MKKLTGKQIATTLAVPILSIGLGWMGYKITNPEHVASLEENININGLEIKEGENSSKDLFIKNLNTIMRNKESLFLVYAHNISGMNWKIPLSTNEYFAYKLKKHYITAYEELSDFVTYKDSTIIKIAEAITKDQDKEKSAQTILEFVHRFVYDDLHEKKNAYDYVKYPIETMAEGGGDCEDLAILGASLMKAKGLDVVFFRVPENSAIGVAADHLAIGVEGNFLGHYRKFEDKKYYFAEPTGTEIPAYPIQLRIGEAKEEYINSDIQIYKIE